MFPDTPRMYLEERTDELAGKPAATKRFINELLQNNSMPPDYWQPKAERNDQPEASTSAAQTVVDGNVPRVVDEGPVPVHELNIVPDETNDDGTTAVVVETEEDKLQGKWSDLQSLFPQTDPAFLHQKLVDMQGDMAAYNGWVNESIENKGKDFPTKEEYEKRQKVMIICIK